MAESVIVLMESADRALDHEETEMEDWNFIKSYIMSENFVKFTIELSKLPCIGKLFKRYLHEHFTHSYDIMINFIEGHEQSTKFINNVIENKDFVNKILLESQS